MSYLLQSRKNKSRKKAVSISIIAVFLAVSFLTKTYAPNSSSRFFQALAFPVWKIEDGLHFVFSGMISAIQSKASLEKKIASLNEQIQSNEIKLMVADSVIKENQDLREALGRKGDRQLVLASVLSGPPHSPYDTFIIDAGSNEGLKQGDKVLILTYVVIGEVSEVFPKTAKIKLYSTPGETVNVVIGSQNFETQAVGKGGGNFEVKIPRDIEVNKGDAVTMPDIDPEIYGTVDDIEVRPADSFQYVLFKSPVNINELREVLIEKNF